MTTQEVNLATMSEIELKAAAYDQLSVIEESRHNLQRINGELLKRKQAKPVDQPD